MNRQEQRLVLVSRIVGLVGLLLVAAQFLRIRYFVPADADALYIDKTLGSLRHSTLAMLFILATPLVHRVTKNVNAAGVWLLGAGVWSILHAAMNNMGGQSLVLFWLLCVPLVGALLVGPMVSILGSVLSLLAITVIHKLDSSSQWVSGARAADFNAEITFALLGLLLMITAIAMLFERIRSGANQAVDALRSSRERERLSRRQASHAGAALTYQRSVLDDLAACLEHHHMMRVGELVEASTMAKGDKDDILNMLRKLCIFLDLQQIEGNDFATLPSQIEPQDLLQSVVRGIIDQANRQNTSIVLDLATEPSGVWRADPFRLSIILTEFMRFTLAAYPRRSVRMISRFQRKNLSECHWFLRIEPTGVDSKANRADAASSLGLPALKRIGSAINCQVDIVESPGVGPTFSLDLKLTAPALEDHGRRDHD